MPMIQSSSDTGLTLSGFLIIVALGTFLWKGAPLQSVRPVANDTDTSVNSAPGTVQARLWQDPFLVAQQSFNGGLENSIQNQSEPNAQSEPGTQNSKNIYIEKFEHLTDNLKDKILKSATEGHVNILLVSLDQGNYAELMELRRRFRYAVLSGLGEESYAPEDASTIELLYRKRNNISDECDTLNKQTCTAIPFEWYEKETEFASDRSQASSRKDNDKDKTLVIWLGESLVSDAPLKQSYGFVRSILDQETGCGNPVSVFMLGPSRSGTLRKLIKEEDRDATVKEIKNQTSIGAFNIIAATATIDDKWFAKDKGGTDGRKTLEEQFNGNDCLDEKISFQGKPGGTCLRFLRTINSDGKHIELLVNELTHNRRIRRNSKIVLISEWDTFFGRSLPEEFMEAFDKVFEKQKSNASQKDADQSQKNADPDKKNTDHSNFTRYTFIRGIDGGLDERVADSKRSGKKSGKEPASTDIRVDEKDLRRPTGSSQYDYLRRLTEEIKDKDRAWRSESGQGVKAVVLLGNDVYDKLLIMRALRSELPGAVFATTDLDAQLLHPAEFNWARNNIVASTYGLVPSINKPGKGADNNTESIPVKTPPFRSSYQTSLYTTTRLLFNKDMQEQGLKNTDIAKRIPPLLFEIGRQQTVALPYCFDGECDSEQKKVQVYWNNAGDPDKPYLLFVSLIVLGILLIFAYHQFVPRAAYQVVMISIFLVVFVILGSLIISRDFNADPFDIMTGASIWPAIYIRLLCVMLSIVFIILTLNGLHNSWVRLDKEYFIEKKNSNNASDKSGSGKEIENIRLRELKELCQQKCSAFYKNWFLDEDGTRRLNRVELVERFRNWKSRKSNKYLLILYVSPVLMFFALMSMMMIPRMVPRLISYLVPGQIHFTLLENVFVMAFIWLVIIIFWWRLMYGRIWEEFHVKSVNKWFSHTYPDKFDAREIWLAYREYGNTGQRFMRTIAYIIVYFSFASFIFMILGSSAAPARGVFAFASHLWVVIFSVLFMMAILFLVVDATRLCICWVEHIHTRDLSWTNSKLYDLSKELKMPTKHAEAWLKIHLIGERTSDVTRLIYYPVIILLLMLLARSTYFDNWDFPQPLAIVMTLNFIIAIGSVVKLNHVAQSARSEVLSNLRREAIAGERSGKEAGKPTADEREKLIASLSGLNIGAYMNVWDQPPVRATLMLLGGIAITYAEYIDILF